MSNIEKYIVNDPTPEDIVEINSALAKSEQYVSEIIVGADAIEETSDKIKALVDFANRQKDNEVTWYSGKKTAIESLQALADFQADAIKDLWKYQQLIFKQFTKLSETSNKLLFLGVANAAVTRAVIDQLKTKSSKPLSEDARRHLLNVVKDLERQADAQDRINRLRDSMYSGLSNEETNRRNEIASVQASILGVKKSLSALVNTEVENRKNEIASVQASILEVKKSLSALVNTEVENRKNEIASVQASILEVENTVSALVNTEIENRKNYISSVQASILEVEKTVSALINTEVENRKNDISSVQASILEVEKTVSALVNSEVENRKTYIASIQTSIYNLQKENSRLKSQSKLSFLMAIVSFIMSMLTICAKFIL